jgi:DnaK suppressor protein
LVEGNCRNSLRTRPGAHRAGAQNARMNDTERKELAGLLERRRAELQEATDRLRAALSQPAEAGWPEVRDSVEDGDARMAATMDVIDLRRQEGELREVSEAQQRLHAGDYGRCETCDEPIPIARLRVRPEARFCIRHEEAWEQAHPGAATGRP